MCVDQLFWNCCVCLMLFSVLRFFYIFVVCCFCCFLFFKQKTAYEMRISDWSSDVCSSDLAKIGFDRWRMDRMQQALDAAGVVLPLEAFGQGYVSMSPALDALEADLLQERLRHGGHPALAMCAANA